MFSKYVQGSHLIAIVCLRLARMDDRDDKGLNPHLSRIELNFVSPFSLIGVILWQKSIIKLVYIQ